MPIGIVDFLQATDGKYALVISMPIGIVGFRRICGGGGGDGAVAFRRRPRRRRR